jgi:hypothetical protein
MIHKTVVGASVATTVVLAAACAPSTPAPAAPPSPVVAAGSSWLPAPVVPLESQPQPALAVDAPLPDQLAKGLVVIRYQPENLRIVPVYGPNALDVSPRIGHVHVTVDDAPWHWADASGEPLIIQGLPAGPHRVWVGLADPTHMIMDSKTVDFVVPAH